ncbi:MAG: hypothetical protein KBT28_10775 [Bacteroidales bacterium]|nr:hypothetical protein [Candidatus Colimorpha merdihippi]
MANKKIIHVRLHIPITSGQDFYFSNIRQIYSVLNPKQVGITYSALVNTKFSYTHYYANKNCVITTETLY